MALEAGGQILHTRSVREARFETKEGSGLLTIPIEYGDTCKMPETLAKWPPDCL